MEGTTRAGLGVGVGAFAASVVGQAHAFERAESLVNAQIEGDLRVLGATGRLPDVGPVLPLNAQPRNKVFILMTSLVVGFLIVCVPTVIVGLIMGPQNDIPPALVVLSSVMYGIGFGVFAGWVPGLFVFAVRGHRENVRRVKAVVIERYLAYWQERCAAQEALQQGADPAHVAARLGSHHLAQFAA